MLVRDCAKEGAKIGCYDERHGGAKGRMCVCNDDLCNSGVQYGASNLFLGTITAFVLMNFVCNPTLETIG